MKKPKINNALTGMAAIVLLSLAVLVSALSVNKFKLVYQPRAEIIYGSCSSLNLRIHGTGDPSKLAQVKSMVKCDGDPNPGAPGYLCSANGQPAYKNGVDGDPLSVGGCTCYNKNGYNPKASWSVSVPEGCTGGGSDTFTVDNVTNYNPEVNVNCPPPTSTTCGNPCSISANNCSDGSTCKGPTGQDSGFCVAPGQENQCNQNPNSTTCCTPNATPVPATPVPATPTPIPDHNDCSGTYKCVGNKTCNGQPESPSNPAVCSSACGGQWCKGGVCECTTQGQCQATCKNLNISNTWNGTVFTNFISGGDRIDNAGTVSYTPGYTADGTPNTLLELRSTTSNSCGAKNKIQYDYSTNGGTTWTTFVGNAYNSNSNQLGYIHNAGTSTYQRRENFSLPLYQLSNQQAFIIRVTEYSDHGDAGPCYVKVASATVPTNTPTPTTNVKPSTTPTPTPTVKPSPTPTPTPVPNGCGSQCNSTTSLCSSGLNCIQANNGNNYCTMPQYTEQCKSNPGAVGCCNAPTATPTPNPSATVTPTPNPSATPGPTAIFIAQNSPQPTIPGSTTAPTLPPTGIPAPWLLVVAPLALLLLGLVF